MTAVLNRIKDGYGSIKNHLTPNKILVGLALAPVIWFVASRAITKAGSYWQHMQEDRKFRFEFNQNSQIEKIDCHFGQTVDGQFRNIEFFRNEAESRKATDLYCLAKAIIKANNESVVESLNLLSEASSKGLGIADKLLCSRERYSNAELVDKEELYSKFGSICCPPLPQESKGMPKICPWDNSYRM